MDVFVRVSPYQTSNLLKSSAFWPFVFCSQLVDNVPILQIDMVWCYFLLQDISWLSVAGVRLEKAREGIERSHGKDSSRMRLLQAGRYPELALWVYIFTFSVFMLLNTRNNFGQHCETKFLLSYFCRHLRMELLEGVVAYHSGQFDKSRKALTSAQAKFFQVIMNKLYMSREIKLEYRSNRIY